MSDLLLRAELEKMAAVLDVPVAELAFMSHLELADLRELRHAMANHLFDRHVKRFKRLAESTRLLPNKVVAVITKKVMPPSIAAQVTGLLTPKDAVDLAQRLPVSYLADLCVSLDPRRAVPVLQAMPVTQVLDVAMELMRQRLYLTMASFVDALLDQQIRHVADKLDGEALLRVGFYVEENSRLNQIIQLLPESQLASTIHAAVEDEGALWPQALSLAERLESDQAARLANVLADAPPEVLSSLSESLFERDLWRQAVPLLNAMDAAAQEHVIAALASHAESLEGSQEHLSLLLPLLNEGLQKKIQQALGRV